MSKITERLKILNNFFKETAVNVSTTTGFIKKQRKLNPGVFNKLCHFLISQNLTYLENRGISNISVKTIISGINKK